MVWVFGRNYPEITLGQDCYANGNKLFTCEMIIASRSKFPVTCLEWFLEQAFGKCSYSGLLVETSSG